MTKTIPDALQRIRHQCLTLRKTVIVLMALPLLCLTATPVAGDGQGDPEAVGWYSNLLAYARSTYDTVDDWAEVRWGQFARAMRFHDPHHIAAYRGYGNGESLWVRGRLLANRPSGGPGEDDGWWDNLLATYQRWESDEIPGEALELYYGDEVREVVTDHEGYYEASFAVSERYPRTDHVLARYRDEDRVISAVHEVVLPSENAELIVISDMDDTVIHTGITSLLQAARLTFLYNARTRAPLAGVGALYRALAAGSERSPINPVIYVSNSAWNMYDLLRDFVELNNLPAGPLLLRDIGITTDTENHKPETLRTLLKRYDDLPVILVGDSGQHDADIYAALAREHPERVLAIYIRDVDPGEDSDHDARVTKIMSQGEDTGVPFMLVEDSAQIASHLVELGLLPPERLGAIRRAVKADESRESVAEASDALPAADGDEGADSAASSR